MVLGAQARGKAGFVAAGLTSRLDPTLKNHKCCAAYMYISLYY